MTYQELNLAIDLCAFLGIFGGVCALIYLSRKGDVK